MVNNLLIKVTAIVVRDGKVLLVRERGKNRFAFPGGDVKKGEQSSEAIARILLNKIGLKANRYSWLGSFNSTSAEHKVYVIEAVGQVTFMRGCGFSESLWWDGKSPVDIYDHIKILLDHLYKKTGSLVWKRYAR